MKNEKWKLENDFLLAPLTPLPNQLVSADLLTLQRQGQSIADGEHRKRDPLIAKKLFI